MTKILPTVLATTKEEFRAKFENQPVRTLADVWQIDVLDGSRFERTSFADPDALRTLSSLPDLELHFMVGNPLPLIDEWIKNPCVIGAVVHTDIPALKETVDAIANKGLRTGVAIEIDTPLSVLKPLEDNLGMILVMGVHPGASGQPFLGNNVFEKIRVLQTEFPRIRIGVDGGITRDIAKKLMDLGVAELCIGSGIWDAENPAEALRAFQNIL
ncbi:MAG: hypothetical protein WCT24_03870 [Patescibacteria group bacterium]|jgi:ribulose-phosphate 3-epimerase